MKHRSRWKHAGLWVGMLMAVALIMASWNAAAQETRAQPATLPAHYLELPGARLLYRDSGGDGVPVVFLHAHTGNTHSWVHQIAAFTAAGYRVVTYDRRGYGGSIATGNAPAKLPSGADDLQSLVDHLGIKRFNLVASGAGGGVALDYAVAFQDRLLHLVVANTMGGIHDQTLSAMGRRVRFPGFSKLPAEVKELSPSYRAVNPEGVKQWLAIAKLNDPAHMVDQGSRSDVTLAALGKLKVPTLFIAGEADPYMPPPAMRVMAAAVPNAQAVVIPLTSHSAFWEQPEIFNSVVLKFLSGHADK